MSDERTKRCLDPGMSILVGTVDADGVPSCCRGIALASHDDLRTATVYLPVATGPSIIQNVATTNRIAVAASHVIDHCSVQLKGRSVAARVARPDEASFVRDRLDAFAGMIEQVGVPRRIGRSLTHWPAFAIEFEVEQIFEQTPGPNAGRPLR